jgi:exopolysaccharide biosynthesis polyprenyl glycosylphosphotransferase
MAGVLGASVAVLVTRRRDGCDVSVTEEVIGTRMDSRTTRHGTESASKAWQSAYLRQLVLADSVCALTAALAAAHIRFGGMSRLTADYLILTAALPFALVVSQLLAGGYDLRIIGTGSDEFRRTINAAAGVATSVIVVSYVARLDLSRAYAGIALPVATVADLAVRYWLRKRLHARRGSGQCVQRVVAAGHLAAVRDLVTTLDRDSYHGLSVVAACLTGSADEDLVAGVPVAGPLDSVARAVREFGADTVAVLACPEMDPGRLRALAWELEKTGTDLCVAPTLLDVAGPRTTIRPVAGLPLLYLDHPDLVGGKQVVKDVFDRVAAACALVALAPLFGTLALAIRLLDPGPVFFRQTRVGRDGRAFTIYKFRTMVVDADAGKHLLAARNQGSGVLFKVRRDPRVTRTGRWLRRWSLDELPQLVNVLTGDMSLVGPRPALPDEAARYCAQMRRRLAVKPGIPGLWQVSGRSDLPWDDAVRLDTRYVENWSFMLDLQILWKTWSAVIAGKGAY